MGQRGAFKSGPYAGPRPVPLIQRTRKFLQVQGKINSRIREKESAADSSHGDSLSLRDVLERDDVTCAFLYLPDT